jgi:hypothetical protein
MKTTFQTEIPTTFPAPISTQPMPTTPTVSWILLITALLIQLRQTLATSTDLLDQLNELIDSFIELLKTITKISDRK